MKAIFDIGHPAHVHLFKKAIRNLSNYGWEIMVAVRPKEITLELLDSYGFEYHKLMHYDGLVKKLFGMIPIDIEYMKLARSFKPDIFISVGTPYSAHISLISRKPHIAFVDTPAEKNSLFYFSSYGMLRPRNNIIATLDTFPMDFGFKRQVRYKGYHELAYLHPKYFKPDPSILKCLGLTDKDKYIVVRFASWDAVHDIGHRGFKNKKERIDFVRKVAKYFKVFVTSEIGIPELKEYVIPIAPEKAHDLLAFATMYIGEGATMASEAGVLGVPWIFIYTKRLPYLDDQEKKYGLGFTVNNASEALDIFLALEKRKNLSQEWLEKRKRLLDEKIDVAEFMTKLIVKVSKKGCLL